MRHIKPGRGPSMMSGFYSIFAIVFGIIWTFLALQSGAPILFALFGVIFIIYAIVQAIYHFHNASQKNRFSSFDITDDQEEADPLQQHFSSNMAETKQKDSIAYCPWCGAKIEPGYCYCTHCGRELP